MARGPSYRVSFRRRREAKTDYHQRKELVKSGLARFVFRCSLSHSLAQFVEAKMMGDHILASAASQELVREYGWKAPCGNLSAAYLTGFLAGLRAKRRGIEKAVLDSGVKKPVKGSKLYAGLKGVLDAGVDIRCNLDVLPTEERIAGKHVVDYWKNLTDPEQRSRIFSQYLNKGLTPEDLQEHFKGVKENIQKAFTQG